MRVSSMKATWALHNVLCAVFPRSWYSERAVQLLDWYLEKFGDPLVISFSFLGVVDNLRRDILKLVLYCVNDKVSV